MDLKSFADWVRFLPHYFDWSIFGTNIGPWLAFLIVTALTFAILMSARFVLQRVLGRIAIGTISKLDDLVVAMIRRTKGAVLLTLAFCIGSLALTLTAREAEFVSFAAAIAILLQVGLWGTLVIAFSIEHALQHRSDDDQGLATAAGALSFISRVVLWSFIGLLALSCLHVDVTALVAGLGVGGIAVALAVQNILGDLFASLSILIDKPFSVGHFIVVGDLAGTVEHVGVKSTRVRSLSGEEVVLSNGDLLKTRIHNYKRLFERRILFAFGITYDTPPDKAAAIPKTVRAIITGIEKTRFDRAHFKDFGDSSLNFEVVYFVLDLDYNIYMDIQQEINLQLLQSFGRDGIEFAFPTRTLYVASTQPATQAEKTSDNGIRSDSQD